MNGMNRILFINAYDSRFFIDDLLLDSNGTLRLRESRKDGECVVVCVVVVMVVAWQYAASLPFGSIVQLCSNVRLKNKREFVDYEVHKS